MAAQATYAANPLASGRVQEETGSIGPPAMATWGFESKVLLYTAYVQTAENNINRRNAGSRYFLSLNVAIVAALGFTVKNTNIGQLDNALTITILVSLAVMFLIQLLWYSFIQSAKRLSEAKYAVINAIEREHFDFHPFADE